MANLELERIDGSKANLADYEGKVVLVVNVASKCGLTPQYTALQSLYERYHGQGLEIIGFPANDFMGQEPGTNDEIVTFCDTNYHVTFPLMAKTTVKGDAMHPLYKQLTGSPEPIGGDVQWNFQKYLLNRKGNPVAKFIPLTKPDDPEVVSAIEGLLKQ